MNMIDNGAIRLCSESFGDTRNPPLLLIMGACCSMLWWEETFCRNIAGRGFFVIRYDNRDTGKSTSYKAGEPAYTFEELSDDALLILDGYGIKQAFVMGMSMGGMLTQMLALRHPDRIKGIILVSSMYFAEGADRLPYSSDAVNAFFKAPFPSTSNDAMLEHTVTQWLIIGASSRPHDEARIRAIARVDIRRAIRYESRINHAAAQVTGDELTRIAEMTPPALVIHGTEDVVIPFIHGELLAKTIPNASLYTLSGGGHGLHPQDYEEVAQRVARFMRASNDGGCAG